MATGAALSVLRKTSTADCPKLIIGYAAAKNFGDDLRLTNGRWPAPQNLGGGLRNIDVRHDALGRNLGSGSHAIDAACRPRSRSVGIGVLIIGIIGVGNGGRLRSIRSLPCRSGF